MRAILHFSVIFQQMSWGAGLLCFAGQGVMLTYGSYMRKSEHIPQTGFIIGIMITIFAILAGLVARFSRIAPL